MSTQCFTPEFKEGAIKQVTERGYYDRHWTGITAERFMQELDANIRCNNEGRIKWSPRALRPVTYPRPPWPCNVKQFRKTSAAPWGHDQVPINTIESLLRGPCRSQVCSSASTRSTRPTAIQ